jgi:mitochondrial distribution and morphology protein 31
LVFGWPRSLDLDRNVSSVTNAFFLCNTYCLPFRTTFFSVVFAVANSLRLQGICVRFPHGGAALRANYIAYVARAISDYLTSETGVTIFFESAIVPKWKDSRISFKNVYITRRPKTEANEPAESGGAIHAAALGYDISNHPANHRIDDEEDGGDKHHHSVEDIEWSMFDLNVDSIDVTLSLWHWLDGKGLVKDAVVKGVRGVLGTRCFSDFLYRLTDFVFKIVAQFGGLLTLIQPRFAK